MLYDKLFKQFTSVERDLDNALLRYYVAQDDTSKEYHYADVCRLYTKKMSLVIECIDNDIDVSEFDVDLMQSVRFLTEIIDNCFFLSECEEDPDRSKMWLLFVKEALYAKDLFLHFIYD